MRSRREPGHELEDTEAGWECRGSMLGTEEESGETLRKLLHISGVTTILVVNSLMGHCPNSSYTPWFWSNYIHSLKRHHITRSTKIMEADRSTYCTRNQLENSVNFIMIQCKSKIHLPLQHWNVLYSSHLGKRMQESEEVQQQREETWKVSNFFVKSTWAKQQPCAVEWSGVKSFSASILQHIPGLWQWVHDVLPRKAVHLPTASHHNLA